MERDGVELGIQGRCPWRGCNPRATSHMLAPTMPVRYDAGVAPPLIARATLDPAADVIQPNERSVRVTDPGTQLEAVSTASVADERQSRRKIRDDSGAPAPPERAYPTRPSLVRLRSSHTV